MATASPKALRGAEGPPAPSDAIFPAPLQVLFLPKRYKVLYGGRGAGRSWGVSRALLLKGVERPIRVLCTRELQKSIDDSVHRVLRDQIGMLGLESHYTVEAAKIYGVNGTNFAFEGIKNNAAKIKSYEGLDFCWVEEAAKVSKSSWKVLSPTVRKEGSEIWMTYNPDLETDYTHRRWAKNPELAPVPATRFETPPGCPILESADSYVVKMTWRDNPWFPEVLRQEMLADRARPEFYDDYLNIWEGHCLQQLEGAIYSKEMRKAQEEGRICKVPWEREIPVDTFWDLGRADQTAIWFGQRVAMQYRVLGYYAASGESIVHFVKELQRRSYVYGNHYLPHDGKARQLGSHRTIQEVLSAAWPGAVHVVPRQSVADGINAVRLVLGSCWFDEAKCEEGLQALRHYKYRENKSDGQKSAEPLHDWASDGADAFRTLALALRLPKEPSGVLEKLARKVSPWSRRGKAEAPGLGWMA